MKTYLCITLGKFFLSLQTFTEFLTVIYLFILGLFERRAILSLKGDSEIMGLTTYM